jgi:putative oxidoreductase
MKGFLSFLNLNFLPASPDLGLLILRVALGGWMMTHGWDKWQKWGSLVGTFPDPLQIGSKWSLTLTVFAELACASLLVIGFCTRFAALVLAITMGVAFFIVMKGDIIKGEMAGIYFCGYVAIIFAGPGKYAFDSSGGGAR